MKASKRVLLVNPARVVSLLAIGLLAACTGEVDGQKASSNANGSAGSSNSAGTGSSASGTGGGSASGAPATGPQDCEGSEVAMPKRLVRLSFNQLASSLRPSFGDAEAGGGVNSGAGVAATGVRGGATSSFGTSGAGSAGGPRSGSAREPSAATTWPSLVSSR